MQKILFSRAVGAITVSAGLLMLSACQSRHNDPAPELVAKGQAISEQFVATLQPTLQAAMQTGGPVNAIQVCAVEAPRIAADLSASSGWTVNRVSLRARNQRSAVPDSWEAEVLADFDRRQLAGEPVGQLNTAEIVGDEFRYMQAQAAGALCLTCHGADISADVQAALDQHYPQDMATGYLAGQIRGAISVRTALD